MLVLCDIADLIKQHQCMNAVSVAQHQKPFEWPSLMVFTNSCCAKLTPEFVDDKENKLFDFAWAKHIGNIPPEFNHCIGYDEPMPNAKIVHYTQGIPCFPETEDSEFREQWLEEYSNCRSTVPWAEIMGRSVHEEAVMARYRKRLAENA